MESYKKSYAEAVIGCNVLLSQSCWSHIQTQDEEDALVLARFDFEQFSVSVMTSTTNKDSAVMCTAAYTAPELLERGAKPSFHSDMYSLAMVMTEFSLPNRSTPWDREVANSAIIYDYIRRGERPTVTREDLEGLGTDTVERWMTLLRACWDQDPSKRPTSTEARDTISSLCTVERKDTMCKTLHQWMEENSQASLIPLSTHQGMAVEVVDEVVSSFVDQNEVISDDLSRDLTRNFLTNDGSNACVYLCTKIADELFNSDIFNKDQIKKVAAESLSEKQSQLKSALISLQLSINAEGKAFAIYICSPFTILVGVLRSAFIIIDTHKVKDDAGGKQSGLLVHFPFECNNRDKVIDGIVDWVSLRMKSSIEDYATQLHSLLMMDAESDAVTFGEEYYTDIYIEDEDLLNASMEVDRHVTCSTDNASTEPEHSNRQQ